MLRRALLGLTGALLTATAAFAQPVQTAQPARAAPDMGRIIKVDMETGAGRIVLELYPDKAPITVANFLHYVDTRRYNGTHIYRAYAAPNMPTFGLIQGVGFNDASKLYPPIKLEPTSQTGLHHGDGAISMARQAVNSAQADFFILSGDTPSFDADPSKPGDNLGFAAFGRVVEGMDVVHAIMLMPKGGHAKNPVMQGQILTDPVPIVSVKREG
jgi:peptidyl-prolyl cis-trans isomerase A (cyclophilin A)